ncbi:methyltransferase domain-containing protein [Acinetobacter sp. ANC 4779]|uniref:SAM-dependent methyltransferase n=1 Tax=Acinetobacter sp. ANC 4779 TaxID=2529848 RepID=UPI001040C6AE|nr:methyltransferase domain-containing protein [Acinetobacter sp. ANC 4779]TCB49322.1 methyltransferase domain-containing protein [Acinetobacter sp. ANC 4779]
MKWLQAIQQQFSQHKYAINAKHLGDDAELAWSNLGYWDDATSSYPDACRQLADQLAQAVHLTAKDRLLDLGCGQGASLLHWQQHYHVQNIEAVELQSSCVIQIQKHLPQLTAIYPHSFLNLKLIQFTSGFDVVLCIDAAYHSNLNSLLDSVRSVLNSKGRLGFHYLIWSEKWLELNSLQKRKYQWLLKAADVNSDHLMTESALKQTLQDYDFAEIEIRDLSKDVLQGFANYFHKIQQLSHQTADLDAFKIRMTAKLCRKLYAEGVVKYVQISAKNNK